MSADGEHHRCDEGAGLGPVTKDKWLKQNKMIEIKWIEIEK